MDPCDSSTGEIEAAAKFMGRLEAFRRTVAAVFDFIRHEHQNKRHIPFAIDRFATALGRLCFDNRVPNLKHVEKLLTAAARPADELVVIRYRWTDEPEDFQVQSRTAHEVAFVVTGESGHAGDKLLWSCLIAELELPGDCSATVFWESFRERRGAVNFNSLDIDPEGAANARFAAQCVLKHRAIVATTLKRLVWDCDAAQRLLDRMEWEYELIEGFLYRQSPDAIQRLVGSPHEAAFEIAKLNAKSGSTAEPVSYTPAMGIHAAIDPYCAVQLEPPKEALDAISEFAKTPSPTPDANNPFAPASAGTTTLDARNGDEVLAIPKQYLSGWPDILEAVGLKNNDTDKNKVLSLNKRYQGPIPKVGRGGKPRVEKGKLLDWWNGLEEKFQASDAARKDKASAAASALVQQAKAVYISYKCGDDTDAGREREAFIDRLDTSLQTAGYNVRRDKRDIGYKDLIDKFMDELARGHCIVVVLGDQYLRSRFCMDELVRIYLNHNFCKRIVPVVLPDVAGLTPMRRMEYVEFWREQQVEHQQAYALNLGGISHEGFSDFDRVRRIAQNCDAALSHIFAMNCLNQAQLEAKDFQILKQAIDERMEETSAQAGKP